MMMPERQTPEHERQGLRAPDEERLWPAQVVDAALGGGSAIYEPKDRPEADDRESDEPRPAQLLLHEVLEGDPHDTRR